MGISARYGYRIRQVEIITTVVSPAALDILIIRGVAWDVKRQPERQVADLTVGLAAIITPCRSVFYMSTCSFLRKWSGQPGPFTFLSTLSVPWASGALILTDFATVRSIGPETGNREKRAAGPQQKSAIMMISLLIFKCSPCEVVSYLQSCVIVRDLSIFKCTLDLPQAL